MDRRPSRAKTSAVKSHLQKICVSATHTFLMTNLIVLDPGLMQSHQISVDHVDILTVTLRTHFTMHFTY
jgi:hypothetical protein